MKRRHHAGGKNRHGNAHQAKVRHRRFERVKIDERGRPCHGQDEGQEIPDAEPEQHVEVFPDAFGHLFEDETGNERHGADRDVGPGAKIGGSGAASKGVHPHGQKRKPDGRHHACRHDRGDMFFPVLGGETEKTFHQSADDDGPDHAGVSPVRIGGDGHQRGDKRKAHPHDDRKARADFPYRVELHCRPDAGTEDRALKEARDFGG